MRTGFLEHIALKSGPIGYWMTILWSSGLVGIGGTIVGAFIAGIVSKLRNVEVDSDKVGISVIFGIAAICAFFGGYFCRRRLIRLRALYLK